MMDRNTSHGKYFPSLFSWKKPKQSKLLSCHFFFLLPKYIVNLFCFFVNSFRFTLHFYVNKDKVSNKPVIWHFFSPKQSTNSISFYNSKNNLSKSFTKVSETFILKFFSLCMKNLFYFSLFLPQAPSLKLVDYITTMRQRKNCFWSCSATGKIASISVENTLQHCHSGI